MRLGTSDPVEGVAVEREGPECRAVDAEAAAFMDHRRVLMTRSLFEP